MGFQFLESCTTCYCGGMCTCFLLQVVHQCGVADLHRLFQQSLLLPQPSPKILLGGSILPPPPICTRKRLNGPRLDRKTALTFGFQWKPKCKQHLILVDANKTTLKNIEKWWVLIIKACQLFSFFPYSVSS